MVNHKIFYEAEVLPSGHLPWIYELVQISRILLPKIHHLHQCLNISEFVKIMFPFFHLFRQVAYSCFPIVYLKANLAYVSQGLYKEAEQQEKVNTKDHS